MQDKQEQLLELVMASVGKFPTLPTIYNKLNEVTANPRSGAVDVANVIMQDQSATTEILKIANSAMYGFVGKVTTVQQAVVFIGFQEVKALVLALSILNMFKDSKGNEILNPQELWKFSFGVGVVVRNIAKQLNKPNVEEYFVGGIVHGIGKLIFLKTIPEIYYKLVSHAKQNKIYLTQVERKVIGISHSGVAEILGEKWKLPRTLVNAMGNYYSGYVDGRFHLMTSIVHVGVIAAAMFEFGDNCDGLVPQINKEVWKELNLPSDFFSVNMPKMKSEYDQICQIFLKFMESNDKG